MTLPKIAIKGPKEGYCNICREYVKLTYDHVPPKGCVPIKPVELRALTQELGGNKLSGTVSQNGVKFRTICEKCNNELLGANYDKELIKFSNEVKLFLTAKVKTGLHFPLGQVFEIKTQKVLRAIAGHNLASFVPENTNKPLPKAPFPDALRSFFLNDSIQLDSRIQVYYWLFPSNDLIHVKGAGTASIYSNNGIILWDLLKFYPLAYWIVWDKPQAIKINYPELTSNRQLKIDEAEFIKINFSVVPRINFPEAPEDHEYIMYCGQQTAYSRYRKS